MSRMSGVRLTIIGQLLKYRETIPANFTYRATCDLGKAAALALA